MPISSSTTTLEFVAGEAGESFYRLSCDLPCIAMEHLADYIIPWTSDRRAKRRMSMTRRRRILIVDSDPAMRRLLDDHFGEACQVLQAGSAREALHVARSVLLDVIVTELRLPGGGLPFLQDVTVFAPTVPVLVLTAYGTASTPSEVMAAGASGYLTKPTSLSKIEDAIKAAMTRSPSASLASLQQVREDGANQRLTNDR